MGAGGSARDGSNDDGLTNLTSENSSSSQLPFAVDEDVDTKLDLPANGWVSEESGIRMGWWIAGGVVSIAIWLVLFMVFSR